MPDLKLEALRISRLLSPENRIDLLTWVKLAFIAENSVRKSLGLEVHADISYSRIQEYFCENSIIKE